MTPAEHLAWLKSLQTARGDIEAAGVASGIRTVVSGSPRRAPVTARTNSSFRVKPPVRVDQVTDAMRSGILADLGRRLRA